MGYDLRTQRGYDFYEVASALQKSIRRGDAKLAGYMALELFPRYAEYCWKRLLTISAEDCHGLVTQEIKALYDSFHVVNKGKRGGGPEGPYFYLESGHHPVHLRSQPGRRRALQLHLRQETAPLR